MRTPPLRALSLAVAIVLFSLCSLPAQDTDWDRSINAGDTAMAQQHYAEAETSYRGALAIAEKRWKKDARISTALLKLAESRNAQGKQEEAEILARRSSTSMDETLNAHKPKNASDVYLQVNVSTALFEKIGDLFAGNHHYQDAESMYEKSLKRWQEYVSAATPAEQGNEDFYRFFLETAEDTPAKLVSAGMKLGELYQKEGKPKEADTVYEQLATAAEKLYGPNDLRMVPSLTSIANAEFRLGDYAAAEPLLKRVIDVLAASKYKDSPDMADALQNYAVLLNKMGREDAAKPFLDRSRAIRASSPSGPH
jgi:tetratricopeptide (TPR) repeat protein